MMHSNVLTTGFTSALSYQSFHLKIQWLSFIYYDNSEPLISSTHTHSTDKQRHKQLVI